MLIIDEKKSNAVDVAIDFLQKGKVICFATDTVYGVAVDATNSKAVDGLYKLKNVHLHEGDTTILYKEYPLDILYLDPPWGGPDYKEKKELDLFH